MYHFFFCFGQKCVKKKHLRRDSNRWGHSPLDFESNALTTRPWCRLCYYWKPLRKNCFEAGRTLEKYKKWYILDLCVSSLRRGHANLLCIVPILADDLFRGSNFEFPKSIYTAKHLFTKVLCNCKTKKWTQKYPWRDLNPQSSDS